MIGIDVKFQQIAVDGCWISTIQDRRSAGASIANIPALIFSFLTLLLLCVQVERLACPIFISLLSYKEIVVLQTVLRLVAIHCWF